MKLLKNKTLAIAIVLCLLISIEASTILLSTVSAHTPAWQIPTFAYITVEPSPIGVGQQVLVVFWLDKTFDGTAIQNDYRFRNYQLTITKPNGETESKNFDYIVDTTSSQYMAYTPDQVGKYTFNFTFPGQDYNTYSHNLNSQYINDTYLRSTASTTLTVQQEPVPEAPGYPLPTEYWTRPIEGENSNWFAIASNWLGGWGSTNTYNVQPDGIAPNTSHVMWNKLVQFGGVVGGNNIGPNASTYYAGESYEERFNNPLIIQGRLYYPLPRSDSSVTGLGASIGGGYVCVDLRSGEQYWKQNYVAYPSFASLEWFDSPNQHGVIPNGYLWATSGNTWIAYDPLDGEWLFNITNVPSGTRAYGPNGEILQYQFDSTNKWLALWNITQVITNGAANALQYTSYRPVGTVLNSTQRDSYSWNVSLPTLAGAGWSINTATRDLLLCIQGNLGSVSTQTGANMTAISIKPGSIGQILWTKSYAPAPNNITRSLGPVDTVKRVFTMADKETMQWSGYSLDTGALLWGPVGDPRAFQYYSSSIASYNAGAYSTAYGNLYVTGFGGITYCYDDSNGELLWTFGNGGAGNNTNDAETPWGYRPTFISNIADGKIYLFNNEHSGNSPYYKDARIRCLNATTGEEIWNILGWASSTSFYSQAGVIADGYLAYFSTYDGKVYSIGKGPSSLTVEAPMAAIELGKSLVIRGTVTDISAGATQPEQAARFPNGVPAVSDDSETAWMQYVYMQKPKPTNATGVQVSIDVLDDNGNYRNIGVTTSDSSGAFSLQWKPDIEGKYTVIATFAGSKSYYPSFSETSFAVDPAPQSTAAPTAIPQSDADLYFVPAIVGLFVFVAIIGVIIILVLRKRQ